MIRPCQPSNAPQSRSTPRAPGTDETLTIALEGYVCLVGESEAMRTVRAQLRRVSAHFRMVLITGEAGTGKEIVARAMHRLSARPEAQFVSRSAASFLSAVPELLARSSVAAKAAAKAAGRSPAAATIDESARSTLFLGDVNALTSGEQMYLSDALTRLEALRNGFERPRLIFATERDLRALTGAGQFDQKLYRKISAVEIALPALRSRPKDIAVIAAELLQGAVRPAGASAQRFDARALARLEEYRWPGNVRELKRVIELAQMQATGDVIELLHLPPLGGLGEAMQRGAAAGLVSGLTGGPVERLDDVIQSHVLEVLVRCSGNKVRAAARLGISRSTLYRTLENSVAAAPLERLL
jgi:DNA-binding NtrC family response regulator